MRRPSTIVLGLGNPVRSDDGVGIAVARRVQSQVPAGSADVVECERGGLDLLDSITGFRCAHLIDAIQTGQKPPGAIWRLGLADLPNGKPFGCSHDLDLQTALEVGASLGYQLPATLHLWAIEALDVQTISDCLTAPVAASVSECVKRILAEL